MEPMPLTLSSPETFVPQAGLVYRHSRNVDLLPPLCAGCFTLRSFVNLTWWGHSRSVLDDVKVSTPGLSSNDSLRLGNLLHRRS